MRCCAEAAPVIVASASRESRILAIGCFGMYENVCTFYAHSNTEMRTVACEPAHISPRLSGREYRWRRTQSYDPTPCSHTPVAQERSDDHRRIDGNHRVAGLDCSFLTLACARVLVRLAFEPVAQPDLMSSSNTTSTHAKSRSNAEITGCPPKHEGHPKDCNDEPNQCDPAEALLVMRRHAAMVAERGK